jgi:molybdopterin-biosynthesis enzyme MoeA-like protein
MGDKVRHIAIVRDEIEAIAADLKSSIAADARLIFTCGGLGPTDDDVTLAGVAAAIGRKLTVDSKARELVERRYRELASRGYVSHSEMTETRLKMATLPEGAQAIENPIGAAPAVVVQVDNIHIVSLPGVPVELKAIVEGPLQDLLTGLFGRGSYREREITVGCGDESELAAVLSEVARLHPGVYIKSRASHFGRDVRFRIVICVSAASAEEAERIMESASTDLSRLLEAAGIKQ